MIYPLFLESILWLDSEAHGISRPALEQYVRTVIDEFESVFPIQDVYINLIVYPTKEGVIPETGIGGYTYTGERSEVFFDPSISYGKKSFFRALKGTIFHELSHSIRCPIQPSTIAPIDAAIFEGMATVFERVYAQTDPLWGKYEDDAIMADWLKEIMSLPTTNRAYEYLYDHPDGRRWIIYKTGSWMVDLILEQQDITLLDLIQTPVPEFMKLFQASVAKKTVPKTA